MKRTPLAERLMSRVEKQADGCWLYTGCLHASGYGLLSAGGRKSPLLRAHRVSYELHVGPIPGGMHLDHLCRVRNCVNPTHLEPVTQAENNRRAGEARTHCPHGHELEAQVPGERRPGCRTCSRDRMRSNYARKRVTA